MFRHLTLTFLAQTQVHRYKVSHGIFHSVQTYMISHETSVFTSHPRRGQLNMYSIKSVYSSPWLKYQKTCLNRALDLLSGIQYFWTHSLKFIYEPTSSIFKPGNLWPGYLWQLFRKKKGGGDFYLTLHVAFVEFTVLLIIWLILTVLQQRNKRDKIVMW